MPLDSIGITNLLSIPKTPLKSFLRSRVRVPPQHAIFHRPFWIAPFCSSAVRICSASCIDTPVITLYSFVVSVG